jgi:predicted transglutaminase-like cysteine proteinase
MSFRCPRANASGIKKAGWSLAVLLFLSQVALAAPSDADLSAFSIWTKLQSDLVRELAVVNRCRLNRAECTDPAARRFLAIVDAGAQYGGRARIAHINRAANLAIRYQVNLTGEWTPALTALSEGSGDCKQFAVLKYEALRESGVPANRLQIMIVADKARYATHAVLAVREDSDWLVLNNRSSTLVSSRDFLGQFALLWTLNRGNPELDPRDRFARKTQEPCSLDSETPHLGEDATQCRVAY